VEAENRTNLFIDFDDTLFDRDTFRGDLFEVMKSLGVSEEELEQSYRAVYVDGYAGPLAQLRYIDEHIRKVDLVSAEKKIKTFLLDVSKYLYPETITFLQSIDRTKYSPQLLTVGGVNFQRSKVMGCDISKYFDLCHFVTEKKVVALKKIVARDERFILIDDKESELLPVAEYFGGAVVIRATGGNLLNIILEQHA